MCVHPQPWIRPAEVAVVAMDPAELDRRTFEDIGRVYTDWDDIYVPSVSTVLDELPTPTKVKRWKSNNDDWREQRAYKQSRGTLVHYYCLNPLAERELWSQEEAESQEHLQATQERWDRFQRDLAWVVGPDHEAVEDGVTVPNDGPPAWNLTRRLRGILEENILGVEVYVINREVGYAGQFDLLYVDRDGRTVLGDLKTSKGCWEKFPVQLSAYRHAVDVPIDRTEVLRMNPDFHQWEVHGDDSWIETDEQLFERFADLRDRIDDAKITELRERADRQR